MSSPLRLHIAGTSQVLHVPDAMMLFAQCPIECNLGPSASKPLSGLVPLPDGQ